MKISTLSLLGLSAVASAHPTLSRKQAVIDDGVILNYALTLEHLEAAFYHDALAKLSKGDFAKAGYDATFYNNIQEVSYDEDTHVAFLTGALEKAGIPAATACQYSFPFTDVPSFLGLASVLEGVGVSAYLGAAADIANKAYLTAAGTILTVEARHSSYIRQGIKESPFPAPFDVPLDFTNVYTLAAAFIVACPGNPVMLPFVPHPTLTLAATQYNERPGGHVTFLTTGLTLPASGLYAVFYIAGGPVFVAAEQTHGDMYKVAIPETASGQTYIVLNSGNSTLDDSTIIAGPAIVEVYKPGVE